MVPIVDAVLIELENDLSKGRDDDATCEDEDAMVAGEDGGVVEMRTRQVPSSFYSAGQNMFQGCVGRGFNHSTFDRVLFRNAEGESPTPASPPPRKWSGKR